MKGMVEMIRNLLFGAKRTPKPEIHIHKINDTCASNAQPVDQEKFVRTVKVAIKNNKKSLEYLADR